MTSFLQDMRDPEQDLFLIELVGEGSYGAVYRAERRSDGMDVAVKIIPADNPADLLKEVDIMMACTSPYIVRLHDCYYKDNEAWLVMDFVGGGSVCDILESREVTLSEAEARECAAWTALALNYLHSNRKLHRDVKAGNILLTVDGRVKLADFGVSKEVNTMANKAQTAIGTPYWMAPEVIQEVPYDGQADIWSLAITCIEMVEGHPPLSNVHPMRAIFMIPSKPSPTLSQPAKWSREFNDFLARCLEKKPQDRPSSQNLLGHPWIASSVERIRSRNGDLGSSIIEDLSSRHLPYIMSAREDASQANANHVGERSEDISGRKTATLRRRSSRGSGSNGGLQAPELFSQIPGHACKDSFDAQSRPSEHDPGWTEDRSSRNESYSSSGSVIRLPLDADTGEGSDCSSSGSVVRVSVGHHDANLDALSSGDAPFGNREPSGSMRAEGLSAQSGGARLLSNVSSSSADATKINLLAAAKCFAAKGGVDAPSTATIAAGAANASTSIYAMASKEGNPQVKDMLDKLGRLDVQFANDLAKLRESYDTRKAALESELRACFDK